MPGIVMFLSRAYCDQRHRQEVVDGRGATRVHRRVPLHHHVNGVYPGGTPEGTAVGMIVAVVRGSEASQELPKTDGDFQKKPPHAWPQQDLEEEEEAAAKREAKKRKALNPQPYTLDIRTMEELDSQEGFDDRASQRKTAKT